MIKLRDYQEDLYAHVVAAWLTVTSVLLTLATGGGKTVLFSVTMARQFTRFAAIVHRAELLKQISLSLGRAEIKHRIVAPSDTVAMIRRAHLDELGRSYVDQNADAGVISVQTMTSKASGRNAKLQRWVTSLQGAVFDEGHHYIEAGIWAKAFHLLPERAKKLFVTACPERADGTGLGVGEGGFCEVLIEGPQTKWLIDNGYLSQYKYYAPSSDLDTTTVNVTKTGDFNIKQLRGAVERSHLVGDVVDHYRKYADGKRTIVFATDVKTADEMADAYVAAGVSAAALSGNTPAPERERVVSEFTRGTINVLVNVDLFDEGFDVPAIECVILARPTQSLNKYLQMVGRALRILEGKTHAIIIDPVSNWARGHGLPDWPRKWTLKGSCARQRAATKREVKLSVCVECTQPYPHHLKTCPWCGAARVYAGRDGPELVEGDLTELSPDALAGLQAAVAAANMSPEDYAAEQQRDHTPKAAILRNQRLHREKLAVRQHLKELVRFWVAARGELSAGERQRLFYARFGVDMMTCYTLNSELTNKLINAITEGFTDGVQRMGGVTPSSGERSRGEGADRA